MKSFVLVLISFLTAACGIFDYLNPAYTPDERQARILTMDMVTGVYHYVPDSSYYEDSTSWFYKNRCSGLLNLLADGTFRQIIRRVENDSIIHESISTWSHTEKQHFQQGTIES